MNSHLKTYHYIADLNPLDFVFWNYVQDLACLRSHSNLESLKAAIIDAWNSMSQDFIKRSCDAFPRRLQEVIDAQGGSIRK